MASLRVIKTPSGKLSTPVLKHLKVKSHVHATRSTLSIRPLFMSWPDPCSAGQQVGCRGLGVRAAPPPPPRTFCNFCTCLSPWALKRSSSPLMPKSTYLHLTSEIPSHDSPSNRKPREAPLYATVCGKPLMEIASDFMAIMLASMQRNNGRSDTRCRDKKLLAFLPALLSPLPRTLPGASQHSCFPPLPRCTDQLIRLQALGDRTSGVPCSTSLPLLTGLLAAAMSAAQTCPLPASQRLICGPSA